MCKQHNPRKIDKCIINIIELIKETSKFKVLACCCGHGKYNQTIVLKSKNNVIFDLVSNKIIPRKKRFYIKDKQGYYYIPEAVNK